MKKKYIFFGTVLLISGLVVIWVVIFNYLNNMKWIEAPLTESSEKLNNGERGFYQIRGFYITDNDEDKTIISQTLKQYEPLTQLQLVHINLKEFADKPLSETGIAQIKTVLNEYKSKKSDLILRFIYDWDGKGMENEPAFLENVMCHMEQIGEILQEFKNEIFIIQGVFVGNWGEMHGSKFLDAENYVNLIEKMDETMPKEAFLAVRTPSYWRIAANRKEPLNITEAFNSDIMISRLSLFNDGITGDINDCGTYGEITKKESTDLEQHWCRNDELIFQNQLNLYVPNGGEAIIANPLNDFDNAINYFKMIHVSYLNMDYDSEVLDKWKDKVIDDNSVYSGMSGYDYIERHLGYRFVIDSAQIIRKGFFNKSSALTVKIKNVGFASRYTQCDVILSIINKSNNDTVVLEADTDVRYWQPEKVNTITMELPDIEQGEYSVYISVRDVDSGETVFFANEEAGEKVHLGDLIVK